MTMTRFATTEGGAPFGATTEGGIEGWTGPAGVTWSGGAQARKVNESSKQAREGPGAKFIKRDILIQ